MSLPSQSMIDVSKKVLSYLIPIQTQVRKLNRMVDDLQDLKDATVDNDSGLYKGETTLSDETIKKLKIAFATEMHNLNLLTQKIDNIPEYKKNPKVEQFDRIIRIDLENVSRVNKADEDLLTHLKTCEVNGNGSITALVGPPAITIIHPYLYAKSGPDVTLKFNNIQSSSQSTTAVALVNPANALTYLVVLFAGTLEKTSQWYGLYPSPKDINTHFFDKYEKSITDMINGINDKISPTLTGTEKQISDLTSAVATLAKVKVDAKTDDHDHHHDHDDVKPDESITSLLFKAISSNIANSLA